MSDSDARKRVPAAAEPETAPRNNGTGQRGKTGVNKPAREIGGVDGPEPTRYGDWERNGRCTDF